MDIAILVVSGLNAVFIGLLTAGVWAVAKVAKKFSPAAK